MIDVGIDPSQRRSAIAWVEAGYDLRLGMYHVVGPVELIGSFGPLLWLAEDPVFVRVRIECPTWTGVGTREVRAAATAWERRIKALFPRRNLIRRVDPRTWQRAVLPSCTTMTTKEQAIWYCREVLGIGDVVGEDPDLADAACILVYQRVQARLGAK